MAYQNKPFDFAHQENLQYTVPPTIYALSLASQELFERMIKIIDILEQISPPKDH